MSAPDRRLVVSEAARQDYEDILLFSVEQWGELQAAKYRNLLDRSLERLLEFPEMGRLIPEILAGGRRMKAGEHVVFYTVTADAIIIHRLLHKNRLPTSGMMDPDN